MVIPEVVTGGLSQVSRLGSYEPSGAAVSSYSR
jgi:hypothetical protein